MAKLLLTGAINTQIDANGNEIINASNIIPAYTAGATYADNDQVIFNDKLFIANKAITNAPATLNTADWDEAGSGGGDTSALENEIRANKEGLNTVKEELHPITDPTGTVTYGDTNLITSDFNFLFTNYSVHQNSLSIRWGGGSFRGLPDTLQIPGVGSEDTIARMTDTGRIVYAFADDAAATAGTVSATFEVTAKVAYNNTQGAVIWTLRPVDQASIDYVIAQGTRNGDAVTFTDTQEEALYGHLRTQASVADVNPAIVTSAVDGTLGRGIDPSTIATTSQIPTTGTVPTSWDDKADTTRVPGAGNPPASWDDVFRGNAPVHGVGSNYAIYSNADPVPVGEVAVRSGFTPHGLIQADENETPVVIIGQIFDVHLQYTQAVESTRISLAGEFFYSGNVAGNPNPVNGDGIARTASEDIVTLRVHITDEFLANGLATALQNADIDTARPQLQVRQNGIWSPLMEIPNTFVEEGGEITLAGGHAVTVADGTFRLGQTRNQTPVIDVVEEGLNLNTNPTIQSLENRVEAIQSESGTTFHTHTAPFWGWVPYPGNIDRNGGQGGGAAENSDQSTWTGLPLWDGTNRLNGGVANNSYRINDAFALINTSRFGDGGHSLVPATAAIEAVNTWNNNGPRLDGS